MPIPSQEEYEQGEIQRAKRREQGANQAPLAERKEAQSTLARALRDPMRMGLHVELLLRGDYGYGEMLLARQPSKHTNRAAILVQLVGIYNHQCPRRMTTEAWKQLTEKEQRALQRELEAVIAKHDRTMAED